MCDETILFTPVAECENLHYFACKLNEVIVVDGSPLSFFSSQMYICRFIINTFSEIIAAPMSGTEDQIEIITENDYFLIKKLQIFLKDENLLCSDSRPATLENYKKCIMYTIKVRLSPSWNRLGQYLCQEDDFLIASKEINAIKFDVIVTRQGLHLKFKTFKLQIDPLKIDDLQLSSSLVAEFNQNPDGEIELGQSWFHVLPSTFKARLLSVSKQINMKTTFKNYQELRNHWKNMYGYILPENSEGMLYYQVHFRAFPNQVFLYPSICLLSQAPKIISHKLDFLTSGKFEKDLKSKIFSICGKTLSFEKIDLNEFKTTPSPRFFPAKEKTTQNLNSKSVLLSTIFKKLKPEDSKIVNEKSVLKLKQQTLNFPKIVYPIEKSSASSLKNSNSIDNSSKNESNTWKIDSPDLSETIISEYTLSQPITRKLIVNQKYEDDSVGQKNETYNSILRKNNYKNLTERKHPKEKALIDALLQEKFDGDTLKKVFPPPTTRVPTIKRKSDSPTESISKYFKEQKSTLHNPIKIEGSRLQFHKLKK